jgi:hypothetical protein
MSKAASADRRLISIRGAREHNLKYIDVDLSRDSLVVLAGLRAAHAPAQMPLGIDFSECGTLITVGA